MMIHSENAGPYKYLLEDVIIFASQLVPLPKNLKSISFFSSSSIMKPKQKRIAIFVLKTGTLCVCIFSSSIAIASVICQMFMKAS